MANVQVLRLSCRDALQQNYVITWILLSRLSGLLYEKTIFPLKHPPEARLMLDVILY